jgi:extradiol dioxygenase family protein
MLGSVVDRTTWERIKERVEDKGIDYMKSDAQLNNSPR